jgi:hypothetical protein
MRMRFERVPREWNQELGRGMERYVQVFKKFQLRDGAILTQRPYHLWARPHPKGLPPLIFIGPRGMKLQPFQLNPPLPSLIHYLQGISLVDSVSQEKKVFYNRTVPQHKLFDIRHSFYTSRHVFMVIKETILWRTSLLNMYIKFEKLSWVDYVTERDVGDDTWWNIFTITYFNNINTVNIIMPN